MFIARKNYFNYFMISAITINEKPILNLSQFADYFLMNA